MGGVMDEAAKGVASIDNAISIGLLPGFDFEGGSSALTIPITTVRYSKPFTGAHLVHNATSQVISRHAARGD
jgi:predicted Rossmann-fold nucleotide-binding protein